MNTRKHALLGDGWIWPPPTGDAQDPVSLVHLHEAPAGRLQIGPQYQGRGCLMLMMKGAQSIQIDLHYGIAVKNHHRLAGKIGLRLFDSTPRAKDHRLLGIPNAEAVF